MTTANHLFQNRRDHHTLLRLHRVHLHPLLPGPTPRLGHQIHLHAARPRNHPRPRGARPRRCRARRAHPGQSHAHRPPLGALGVRLHVSVLQRPHLRVRVLHPDHPDHAGVLDGDSVLALCTAVSVQHLLDGRGCVAGGSISVADALDGVECGYHAYRTTPDGVSQEQRRSILR